MLAVFAGDSVGEGVVGAAALRRWLFAVALPASIRAAFHQD